MDDEAERSAITPSRTDADDVAPREGLEELAARLRSELAIDAAGIGTFDWDLATGRLDWDDRLLTMFGHGPETFDGTIASFRERVHDDDRERVTDAMAAAITGCAEFDLLYRIDLPGGATRWISARGRVLCDPDGMPDRMLGAAYDITERSVGDQGVLRVLEAMPAAFYSLDPQWRLSYVNAEAERLLGRSRDELLGRVIWDAFPAAVDSVFEEGYRRAVRSNEPVAFDAHYPAPLNGWYEVRAWPTPDGLSVYFLEVTERRAAQEHAQRANERLALLAGVSRELVGPLAADVATGRLPRMVVPLLADGCLVTVLDRRGHPASVGSWHADEPTRGSLAEHGRALLDLPAVAHALATGERTPVPGTDPGVEARDLLAELAAEAAVVVPLRGGGRTLGSLTLLYAAGRRPGEAELATAQDLADRTGLALDSARLHAEQRQLAEELQRSLLTEPHQPEHAEIVVRYLPATESAAVGGDWYDAFPQRDGATLLVIGDVAGHDTAAAATMAQLRGLLRGIATSGDPGPAAVLGALDNSMALLGVRTLATAAVARFEPGTGEPGPDAVRMRWSSAGHLPPFTIGADGGVRPLTSTRTDLLLGVDPTAERTESVVDLERGATVLLYTDGLVERRDADLDAGLARLHDTLAEYADRPLPELCDLLVQRLVDGRPDDDVAIVAVRLHPPG